MDIQSRTIFFSLVLQKRRNGNCAKEERREKKSNDGNTPAYIMNSIQTYSNIM